MFICNSLRVIALLAVLTPSVPGQVPEFTLVQTHSKAGLPSPNLADSVAKVVAQSDCLSNYTSSAVIVAPGIVITNAHGVQGAHDIHIHKNGKVYHVSHHILDADLDLCLLKVPGLPGQPVPLAESGLPELGTEVQAIGFPHGAGPICSQGRINAIWKIRQSHLFQCSAYVFPGSSGGGLFSQDGRLLGITTFTLLANQGFNISVPSKWIPLLLARPWQPSPSVNLCKPSEIILQEFIERITEEPSNHMAWEAFSRAWVSSNPRDASAWYSLGHVLTQRLTHGAPESLNDALAESARCAYLRAIELNPAHLHSWNNMGVLHSLLGQEREAIRAFEAALAMDPNYGLAWLNLGGSHFNQRNFTKAIQAFQKGVPR